MPHCRPGRCQANQLQNEEELQSKCAAFHGLRPQSLHLLEFMCLSASVGRLLWVLARKADSIPKLPLSSRWISEKQSIDFYLQARSESHQMLSLSRCVAAERARHCVPLLLLSADALSAL